MAFKTVRFMTAGEKWLVLSAWKGFLRSGLKEKCFSERLYKHLTLHCSFIAHYSRVGFYQHYFEDPDMALKFLSQFDQDGPCLSVEYGTEHWLRNGNDVSGEYYDINSMMVKVGTLFIPALKSKLQGQQRSKELSMATTLLAKHGYTISKE